MTRVSWVLGLLRLRRNIPSRVPMLCYEGLGKELRIPHEKFRALDTPTASAWPGVTAEHSAPFLCRSRLALTRRPPLLGQVDRPCCVCPPSAPLFGLSFVGPCLASLRLSGSNTLSACPLYI